MVVYRSIQIIPMVSHQAVAEVSRTGPMGEIGRCGSRMAEQNTDGTV